MGTIMEKGLGWDSGEERTELREKEEGETNSMSVTQYLKQFSFGTEEQKENVANTSLWTPSFSHNSVSLCLAWIVQYKNNLCNKSGPILNLCCEAYKGSVLTRFFCLLQGLLCFFSPLCSFGKFARFHLWWFTIKHIYRLNTILHQTYGAIKCAHQMTANQSNNTS